MGKRKKSSLVTNAVKNKIGKLDDNTIKEAELKTIHVNTKNKKMKSQNKNKINEINSEQNKINNSGLNTTESNSEIAESHRESHSKKKRKNNIKSGNTHEEDEDSVVDNKLLSDNEDDDESGTCIQKKGKNKKVKPNREELEKSNKEQVVEISKEMNIQTKNKKSDLEQEDDVKDEDIDKFCEEIDEEDNLQYLNWVEQIEAKLNCNKKKPK